MKDKHGIEWYDIPNHPGYQMTQDKRIRMFNSIGICRKVRSDKQYVFINKEYKLLYQLYISTFGQLPIPANSIRYVSEEGRAPFDRYRVYNHILRFMPDVQIAITPDATGKYETSPGMRERGMIACDCCGHIQATEIKICKECNQFITI